MVATKASAKVKFQQNWATRLERSMVRIMEQKMQKAMIMPTTIVPSSLSQNNPQRCGVGSGGKSSMLSSAASRSSSS